MASEEVDLLGPRPKMPAPPKRPGIHTDRRSKMQHVYGPGPEGEKCGNCAHLHGFAMANKWFKCVKYGVSGSPASDWRKKWPACGAFEPRTSETKVHDIP